jgi:hypothetical protein
MGVRWLLVVLFAGCADPKLPDQQMDRFIEQLGAKVNRPA